MFKDFFIGKVSKINIGVLVVALVVGGLSAQATGLNSTDDRYFVCVKPENGIVTHFANSIAAKCPKGFKKTRIGARGEQGMTGPIGLIGATGPQGPQGAQGPGGGSGSAGANGTNGTNGTIGADGQGPVFIKNSEMVAITRAGVEVINLSLAAGTYLLTYSAIAFSVGPQDYVWCGIEDINVSGGRGTVVKSEAPDGDLNNRKHMTEQKTLTLTSPGTAKVYCKSQFGDSNVSASEQIFTALKVSSATVQP